MLGIKNATDVFNRLDEDERGRFNLGRQGNANIINEAGLYNVILRSDKPEAKGFKRWVTHEVLPAIRKTGTYTVSEDRKMRSQAMLENAKSRQAALWLKIADNVTVPEYKGICASYASKTLAGKESPAPARSGGETLYSL